MDIYNTRMYMVRYLVLAKPVFFFFSDAECCGASADHMLYSWERKVRCLLLFLLWLLNGRALRPEV